VAHALLDALRAQGTVSAWLAHARSVTVVHCSKRTVSSSGSRLARSSVSTHDTRSCNRARKVRRRQRVAPSGCLRISRAMPSAPGAASRAPGRTAGTPRAACLARLGSPPTRAAPRASGHQQPRRMPAKCRKSGMGGSSAPVKSAVCADAPCEPARRTLVAGLQRAAEARVERAERRAGWTAAGRGPAARRLLPARPATAAACGAAEASISAPGATVSGAWTGARAAGLSRFRRVVATASMQPEKRQSTLVVRGLSTLQIAPPIATPTAACVAPPSSWGATERQQATAACAVAAFFWGRTCGCGHWARTRRGWPAA
jgi:hypothetical protein